MTETVKILVVDDEEDIREILGDIVSEIGEVSFAKDGAEALKAVRSSEIDLILTDISMPIMDGVKFVETMVETMSEKYNNLEVIVISGFADKENSRQLMRAGAYDIVDKPFDHDIVISRSEKALLRLKNRRITNRMLVAMADFLNYKAKVNFNNISPQKKFTYLSGLIAILELKNQNK